MAGEENKGFIDLGMVGELFSGVMRGAQASQTADSQLFGDTIRENKIVEESANRQQLMTQAAMAEAEKIKAAGQYSRKLASGSLLDGIELITAQALDPTNFTAEGRQKQLGDTQNLLTASQNMHQATVAASQARIQTRLTTNSLAKFEATAGLEMLKTQVSTLGIIGQGVAATEAMRELQLTKLTPDEIQEGIKLADLGDGNAEFNGLKFSRLELQEAKKANDLRTQLAFLIPTEKDPNFVARADSYIAATLPFMTTAQLQELQAGKGVLAPGITVPDSVLTTAIAESMKNDSAKVTQKLDAATAVQQVPQTLATLQADLKFYESRFEPGTPMGAAFDQYRLATSIIGSNSEEANKTTGGKLALIQQAQTARNEFQAKLDAEAVAQAGGDTDLVPILRSQLMGKAVDPRALNDYVVNRYVAGKSFARVMDPKGAAELTAAIERRFTEGKSAQFSIMGDKPTKDELAEIRSNAANAGVQDFITNKARTIMQAAPIEALRDPSNPLVAAGIDDKAYTQISFQASQMAREAVQTQRELTPVQIEALSRNKPAEAGIDSERAREINNEINQQTIIMEYDLLNQRSPGLGVAYSEWISMNLPAIAQEAAKGQGQMAAMFTENVGEQAMAVGAVWSAANENATQRGKRVLFESLTQTRRPENMFRNVLTLIPDVTPEEQQLVYDTLIGPAIQSAKAKRLNPQQTSDLIGLALQEGTPDSVPATKAAIKILRALPASLANYEAVLQLFADTNITRDPANITQNPNAMAVLGRKSVAGPPTAQQSISQQVNQKGGALAGNGIARSIIESEGGTNVYMDAIMKAIK